MRLVRLLALFVVACGATTPGPATPAPPTSSVSSGEAVVPEQHAAPSPPAPTTAPIADLDVPELIREPLSICSNGRIDPTVGTAHGEVVLPGEQTIVDVIFDPTTTTIKDPRLLACIKSRLIGIHPAFEVHGKNTRVPF